MKQSTPQAVKPETNKSDDSSMCEDVCRCKSPVDPVVATAVPVDFLEDVMVWIKYGGHRKWCNAHAGNFLAADDDHCDCGMSEIAERLEKIINNKTP